MKKKSPSNDQSHFHSINNQLTIIMGAVDLLNIYNQKGKYDSQKIDKHLSDSKEAIKEIIGMLKLESELESSSEADASSDQHSILDIA